MNKANYLKIFTLIFCLFFINAALLSQSLKDHIRFGESAFKDGDYYSAAFYLNKAYEQAPSDISILYKLAESYRLSHAYKDASRCFKAIAQNAQSSNFPLLNLNYALVEKSLGNYDAAIELLTEFLKKKLTNDVSVLKRAEQELASCIFAQKIIKDTVEVVISRLEESINTTYSEFNAYPIGDSILYFSSLRPSAKESPTALIPPSFKTRIYSSNLSISGWSQAKEIDARINTRDGHHANVCFNPEKNTMYFSRCEEKTPNKMLCHLYKSYWQVNRWSMPQKLKGNINLANFTSTQPSYGRIDGSRDVLFFVSDRPGGQGGMDIWYAIINEDRYQEPINLGSFINTPGDEISPFFHIPTGALYFSSDWHKGLGGFDIFKTKGFFNTWTEPENLGFPINSSYNDTYYVLSEDYPEAYLTSNRVGSLYLKGETCCNDIYFLKYPTPIVVDSIIEDIVDVIEDSVITIESVINELLPLTLYFHNDEPDPATTRITSTKNYKETLEAYVKLRDIYKKEYAAGLSGNEKLQAENDINHFFDDYVLSGFDKLESFTAWLLEDLEAGNSVQITIRGYCSPLNTSQYNINLSKRRISSLINFMREFDNGSLVKYIDKTAENGAQLDIYGEPLGDREASAFVSNNPHDVRNSIYSRAAALERKVEIVQYNSGHDSTDLNFPEITFNQLQHDFKNIKTGDKKTHIFTFRNTGQSPLFITSVETTSSNIITDWQVKEIKPGTSGVINVLFDTKNLEGAFKEYIYVTGNTKQGKISIELNAFIE